ncbi:MAG: hypothetical protein K1X67_22185 [Fimbriimonadaceae bacterium]|nr:hypothetical protein [Fimbriimonadaceae bacterium]
MRKIIGVSFDLRRPHPTVLDFTQADVDLPTAGSMTLKAALSTGPACEPVSTLHSPQKSLRTVRKFFRALYPIA